MIRRALAMSFSRLADALSPKPPSQEQEEERAVLVARVAELEAEREWKPWPPAVLDGRRLVFVCPELGLCFLTRAETPYLFVYPAFYRELGPVPGDSHA
jgi:hypothetical protein